MKKVYKSVGIGRGYWQKNQDSALSHTTRIPPADSMNTQRVLFAHLTQFYDRD